MKRGFVYILSNYSRTVLYIGVTNDLERRILEHKRGEGSVFTTKYQCKYLMYMETLPSMLTAIQREKQLKRWHKEWKWNLIKQENPECIDLAAGWYHKNDLENPEK